jgi:hypothetical protein
MMHSISQWCYRRPYTTTSIIFLVILLFGWQELGWGERQLGFLLLLYFIITLGIRLDDISRAIGGAPGSNPRNVHGEPESLSAQLREIQLLLRQIQGTLDKPSRGDDADEL